MGALFTLQEMSVTMQIASACLCLKTCKKSKETQRTVVRFNLHLLVSFLLVFLTNNKWVQGYNADGSKNTILAQGRL